VTDCFLEARLPEPNVLFLGVVFTGRESSAEVPDISFCFKGDLTFGAAV
jgi:hypothetical protein